MTLSNLPNFRNETVRPKQSGMGMSRPQRKTELSDTERTGKAQPPRFTSPDPEMAKFRRVPYLCSQPRKDSVPFQGISCETSGNEALGLLGQGFPVQFSSSIGARRDLRELIYLLILELKRQQLSSLYIKLRHLILHHFTVSMTKVALLIL